MIFMTCRHANVHLVLRHTHVITHEIINITINMYIIVENFRQFFLAPDHGPGRPHKLNITNRLLLLFVWLKTYPPYYMLAALFDIDERNVGAVIREMTPLFWLYCCSTISWPTCDEWLRMRGHISTLPDVVALIDGTVHEIQIPSTEHDGTFYSGYHKYHCFSTQITGDVNRQIRYIHTGFVGRLNDAGQFNQLPDIGPQGQLRFPLTCRILADKGYVNRYPLIIPVRRNTLRAAPPDAREALMILNGEINRNRTYIEHLIRLMKTYRAVSTMSRHDRNIIPTLCDICAFLAQRHARLFYTSHG